MYTLLVSYFQLFLLLLILLLVGTSCIYQIILLYAIGVNALLPTNFTFLNSQEDQNTTPLILTTENFSPMESSFLRSSDSYATECFYLHYFCHNVTLPAHHTVAPNSCTIQLHQFHLQFENLNT